MMARKKVAQDPCGHITSMRSPALYLPFSQNMCKSRHQHANMGGRGWNLNICFSYQVSRRYGTYMHAIGGAWNWNTATICIIHFNMYRRIKISRTAVLLFFNFLPCPYSILSSISPHVLSMLELSFPFPSYPFIHVILSPEFVLVVFLLSCPEWSRLLLFCPEGFCLLLSCPEGSCIFTILSWPVLSFYYPVLSDLVFLLYCPEWSCLFTIPSWAVPFTS